MMNKLKKLLNSRSLKYGSNSFIIIAVVIAIAVVLNVIVNMLSANVVSLKLDLTPNKLYTLGDATKEILKGTKKDVAIYGLFDDGKVGSSEEAKEITGLLDQYAKYPHIALKYVDPDKTPGIVKEIDPEGTKGIQKGDFVFKLGNKIRKVSYDQIFDVQSDQQGQAYKAASKAEQSFTGAIKYVTADKTPTVYFTQGHEEKSADGEYKTLKSYLERNTYDVKATNLITEAKVPDDAEILIIASPKKDLSSIERDKIKEYLKNGGKAVFMFDPLETAPQFTEFETLLSDYNISLNYDRVKENDNNRHVPNAANDIIPELQQNEINMRLEPDKFVMVMPKSRSINILRNEKEYITVTSLMKTSPEAVGEQIDTSKGRDIAGPLDIAVAVEDKGGAKPAKILVLGNGTFMEDNQINKYQQYSVSGMYFFLNSLIWMQDKKDDTIVAPKAYETAKLNMNATQANLVALGTVIVLPLLILILGTAVWLRRRHL